MSFDPRKNKIYIIAVSFAALIPIVSFFNIPVPKVAWLNQVNNLEERQLEKVEDLYQRELIRKRYENRQLQKEIEQLQLQEAPVPNYYLEDQEYLKYDIEKIEETIERAKDRIIELQRTK